jgi:hypothetical protein
MVTVQESTTSGITSKFIRFMLFDVLIKTWKKSLNISKG